MDCVPVGESKRRYVMWEISKSFNFCYGHRVWTQELNKEFSLDSQCKCRHLHGHEATVDVSLFSNTLNKSGMVTDFKHLNWLKKRIDDTIDHKFLIDRNDPLWDTMFNSEEYRLVDDYGGMGARFLPKYTKDRLLAWSSKILEEYYDGFLVVDFPPTSENLSKWMFDIVQKKMSELGISVSKVTWHETPKSVSTYNNEWGT